MAVQVVAPMPPTEAHAEGPAAAIVEARGVIKTYDSGAARVNALRGVDLSVAQGEMVAIMGPSGSGKTTLLNCLSGLDSIDEGEVRIEGTPLAHMSDRERTEYRARRMGFVFQFYNLMPVLTAVENVELPLLLARVDGREARERAQAALEHFRIRAHRIASSKGPSESSEAACAASRSRRNGSTPISGQSRRCPRARMLPSK